jgi:hypothetical protein
MAQPSRRNGNDADVIRHVSKARQSGQPKKESPGHSVEPGILGHGRPWGPGVPAGQEGNVAAPSTVPDSAGGSGAVAGGSDGAARKSAHCVEAGYRKRFGAGRSFSVYHFIQILPINERTLTTPETPRKHPGPNSQPF